MNRPDVLLHNASVYTMDVSVPTAGAVGIRDGHVVACGTKGAVRSAVRHPYQEIDLQGAIVVPGFTDAHIHFVWYSLGLDQVDLQGVPTLEEALKRVAATVENTERGKWIRGGRWNCNLWGDGAFPRAEDLNRIAPHHPVALASKDGHSVWVNSKAMEMAHITAQTPEPAGGHIRRDAAGKPTGILQEKAGRLVGDIIPPPCLEELVSACKLGMPNAHRVGLTGIHDCEGGQQLAAFQELHKRGELGLRVLMHIPHENLDAAISLGIRDGLGDEWLRIAGMKAFADGALGSRSAWMLSPYQNDPTNRGIPTITPDALHELVNRANAAGLSVAIHAIGDAANRVVLDAIEASGDSARPHLRNRIEHVQLLHPDDIPRLASLNVVASMQPIHATADIEIAELRWGKRAETGYAWRSLLRSGARLAFGSDAPVESISPLLGIHAAVTRRRCDGFPGPRGWHPEQRLTVAEAVHAYTMGAAYASGEETIKGSITPGKLADLVVLDRDILRIDPMDIPKTEVLATMVGGRFVHGAERL